MSSPLLDQASSYLNAELSRLRFNRRVLEEAEDETNPLLERLHFLALSAAHLDEFIEVRLAALLQRIEEGVDERGPDGRSPAQVRDLLAPELHALAAAQYGCWNGELRGRLAAAGIRILEWSELGAAGRRFAADYCAREVDPLLTPLLVDAARPFPRILNKALGLAFLLRSKRRRGGAAEPNLGVVTVPRALPRLVRLPGAREDYIYLAHLVGRHARAMYRGFTVETAVAFRVTRNSNLYWNEEESRSLLETVQLELHNRRRGNAVRLEVEAGADACVVERLRTNFELEPWQVFTSEGPVNLSRLDALRDLVPRPELKFPPFSAPPPAPDPAPFAALRLRDRLLHHPYDSFEPVMQFLEAAAADPRVVAIKQTLYRAGDDSRMLAALEAAAADKEVAVVVELKARSDEARNIRWARRLEEAGVQVSYGASGRKTHCKMLLVARQDEDGELRRYLHLGTGNYNLRTAELYTDFSLLTARAELGAAADAVFAFLTAGTEPARGGPLLVAPTELATRLRGLVQREAEHARRGRRARIILKVNGLLDRPLIRSLYAASQAGVRVDLLVRGDCALRPGVRGLSHRITVRSLVGRFLEHSRICYFHNGGEEEVYLGSADWMPRNLYGRIEVVFPVLDAEQRRWIRDHVLRAYLADTARTRWLRPDGTYQRPGQRKFSAQAYFMACARGQVSGPPPAEARL